MTEPHNTYTSSLPCGIIGSTSSNIIFCKKITIGNSAKPYKNVAICGALQNIYFWNMRTSELIFVLHGDKSAVNKIIYINEGCLAAGYTDGNIRIHKLDEKADSVLLTGHKSAISTLDFDSCSRLVSGSLDTYIILWDILSETGLCRLKGHTSPITACQFMPGHDILISSSKDTTIKLWDLSTYHCFATLIGHNSAIRDFIWFSQKNLLVVATSEKQLRMWHLEQRQSQPGKRTLSASTNYKDVPFICKMMSPILKKNHSKTRSLYFEESQNLILCLNKNSSIEVIKFIADNKAKNRTEGNCNEEINGSFYQIGTILEENISHFTTFFEQKKQRLYICSLTNNNMLKLSKVNIYSKMADFKLKEVFCISNMGHRSPPSSVAITSTSEYFATSSTEQIKIWSTSHKCLRSIHSTNSSSMIFMLNDKVLIVATTSGFLILFNVSNGVEVSRLKAHDETIWELKIRCQKTFASCSSDKTLKIWRIEENDFKIELLRVLQADDAILCLSFSLDLKFIAIGLIDSNIKVFYEDTFKNYLTLYGHKLPVNSIDISHDQQIIISVSDDKNIKIWGLSFGDCRKSIFGHAQRINKIKFIPSTHRFLTCSDDGLIKYWDADNFKLIMEFNKHHNSVKTFDINFDGTLFISASTDYSINIWNQMNDYIIPENNFDELPLMIKPFVNEIENEALFPFKTSSQTLSYSESIVEAIDILESEKSKTSSETHPIIKHLKITPEDYVKKTLSETPSNYLDVTLTTIPYEYALKLLHLLSSWIDNESDVELCCRCIAFLVKIHFYQLYNANETANLIVSLCAKSKNQLKSIKSKIGLNLSALQHLQKYSENILMKEVERTIN